MKTNLKLPQTRIHCALALGIASFFGLAAATDFSAGTAPATTAIPWSQLGAKAGTNYHGDALAVITTAEGARLSCAFQRLEGEATPEGLWLTSTVLPPGGTMNDCFRLVAVEVGRRAPPAVAGATARSANHQSPAIQLPATGNVSIDGQSVRFTRSGLVEEYTTSMDGVRQDFVVMERSPGVGELVLRLAVSGAKVESAAFGAQVVLANSGRKIAYSRLKVTDANGRELPARMEVATAAQSEIRNQKSEILCVVVNDAQAVYPVRIDPTFSDANWSSMGGIAGADSWVTAVVADGSGNLYIGGNFSVAGDVIANRVAKWNGSSWSALGSRLDGGDNPYVSALAVSGSDLYVGGTFTTAGGITASNIAKWNGSSWTALGSGMDGGVRALAVSGSDLYAGGHFTTAGGNSTTNHIAKWNGSSWSALGSGMVGGLGDYSAVAALAVSGSNVYAAALHEGWGTIFKWDGNSWSELGSALGSGIVGWVYALAVSGSDLYAGGYINTAGGNAANHIAKWDGSTWTTLGSGMNSEVQALAVSGSDLYAGGGFTTAGGSPANYIAKWNGNSWSALGSGMNEGVRALAVSASDLYVGGAFTTAGGKVSAFIARAYLPALPTLSVLRSSENVTLTWSAMGTAGFALEQAGLLAAPAGWVTNSATVTDDGANKSVTLPFMNSPQFFRLRRP